MSTWRMKTYLVTATHTHTQSNLSFYYIIIYCFLHCTETSTNACYSTWKNLLRVTFTCLRSVVCCVFLIFKHVVPGTCRHLELFDFQAEEHRTRIKTPMFDFQANSILSHPLPRVFKNVFQLVLICLPAVRAPLFLTQHFAERSIFRKDSCWQKQSYTWPQAGLCMNERPLLSGLGGPWVQMYYQPTECEWQDRPKGRGSGCHIVGAPLLWRG